ncbi:MAG TPA: serine protease [Usitatibacter sp.]|jgi:hypothetical protein|nr:serine protease [Usitatibacter sp.]
MPFRRTLLSAAGVLVCAAAWSQPLNPVLFLPIAASVVRVEAERAQGGLSVGSGVTVAPGVVATNCHVLREASSVRVAGAGTTLAADAERGDVRRDVCFLRVPDWRGRPVNLADADAQVGASVVALGYTGGAAISPRLGSVRALHAYDGAHVIESDAPFNGGSSGGGLFAHDGTLVGLLTFRLRNSETSYFALPVEWVRAGLPREGDWQDIRPLAARPPFWQGEGEALPFFMRAAAYQNEGAWPQLLELTVAWLAAAPHDAEPLRARALALRELHRPRAAAEAFRAALRIEPHDAVALYGLALAYDETGNSEALRETQARLDALDDDVSRDLVHRLASRGGTGGAPVGN